MRLTHHCWWVIILGWSSPLLQKSINHLFDRSCKWFLKPPKLSNKKNVPKKLGGVHSSGWLIPHLLDKIWCDYHPDLESTQENNIVDNVDNDKKSNNHHDSVLNIFAQFHFFLISNYWFWKCLVRKKKSLHHIQPLRLQQRMDRQRQDQDACGDDASGCVGVKRIVQTWKCMFGRWSFPLGMAQPGRCELLVSGTLPEQFKSLISLGLIGRGGYTTHGYIKELL